MTANGSVSVAPSTSVPGWSRRWSSVRALTELARIAFNADPRAALTASTAFPFELMSGALQALALKALADAATRQDLRTAALAGIFLALVTFGRNVASTAWFAARMKLAERTTLVMQRRLGELAAGIPTIEHLERPDYLRQMDLVRQDVGTLAELFSALVQHASRIGRLALSVALLGTIHPVLCLLPLFGIPSLVATSRAQSIRRRLDEATAEHRRLEAHLQNTAWAESSGKEVRVFGLAGELLLRHERNRATVDRLEDRATLQATLLTAAGWLVFAIGFIGAVGFVVVQAVAGRATVGDVVLALTLAGQVNDSVADLAGTVGWTTRSFALAERYLWLTDYAFRAARRHHDPAPTPTCLERGISLDRVSFTYPGTKQPVLADVSLDLPAGSTIALVGENGAGKTTLVKLLCGLYEPTEGVVRVDGVDLTRLDVIDWRERTSAAFQDFARFMFVARESVGVGDTRYVDDDAAVQAALERAQAQDIVAQLPWGLETQLGRYFKQRVGVADAAGMALSDGQWQKLALSRAMMRPESLLLVLDEPTASLDAPSEHALFERYVGAAKRTAAANGGITVLVSHRFSTVRMADTIVVLQNGRVVATGTHQHLMARGGLYAELYEMQARAYRT
jgi:ATP-binding cassette, subfamily B, bacterial